MIGSQFMQRSRIYIHAARKSTGGAVRSTVTSYKGKTNDNNTSFHTSKNHTLEKNRQDVCVNCLSASKYTITERKEEYEIFFNKKFDNVNVLKICENCFKSFQKFIKKRKENQEIPTKVDKTCYIPRNGIHLFDLNVDYDSDDDLNISC